MWDSTAKSVAAGSDIVEFVRAAQIGASCLPQVRLFELSFATKDLHSHVSSRRIEQLTKRNQVTFTELPVELKRAVPRTATLSDRTQPLWDERFDEQLLYAPPAVKYRNQQPFSDDRLAESMVHVQSSDQLESSVCTVNAPDLDIGGIINVRSDDEDEWAIIEDEHERPPDHSVFRSNLGDSAFFSTLFK